MPWNPGVQFRGGELLAQGIESGVGTLNQDLIKAFQRYDQDKKQHEYNTGLFESIKDDPNLSKYVPQEGLQRWYSMNPDKQAGVLAGIARRADEDVKTRQVQQAEELKNAQADEARSRQNLIEAQAHNEWMGGGAADQRLDLSPEEIAAGANAGKVPLRTSNKSFQWAEDPNNPANLGMAEPMPIDKFGRRVDPSNPAAEVVGVQGANGTIHMFPKPTDMETFLKSQAKSQASPSPSPSATPSPTTTPTPTPKPTATPTATATPPDKVRVRAPNGVVGSIRKDQLQDAIAQGYTLIQ